MGGLRWPCMAPICNMHLFPITAKAHQVVRSLGKRLALSVPNAENISTTRPTKVSTRTFLNDGAPWNLKVGKRERLKSRSSGEGVIAYY